MKVALFNTQGISGKLECIYKFYENEDIDLFIVVETWLNHWNNLVKDPFINITQSMAQNAKRSKGGILLFGKEHFKTKIKTIHLDPDCNYCIISIDNIYMACCYFPPSMDNVEFINTLQEIMEITQDGETIICGDLNARVGDITNDSKYNTRGTKLKHFLEDSNFHIINPNQNNSSAKFTSFSFWGAGITDLIITNSEKIEGLSIHENQSLGGSDHRPITFQMNIKETVKSKEFARWNLKRFLNEETQLKYYNELKNSIDDTKKFIENTDDINICWMKLKQWIEHALKKSCGIFQFKRKCRKDFWTPELLALKDKIVQETKNIQYLLKRQQAPVIREGAHLKLKELNHQLRDLLRKQKMKIFQESMNELSKPENLGAFMKMVKNVNERKKINPGCKLDVDKMEQYANHFANTFGQEPNGNATNTNETYMNTALNEQDINLDIIKTCIKDMKMGKSAGFDKLPIEIFYFGKDLMIKILGIFFKKIEKMKKIPEDWKKALIVPIFKKKGSDLDIKNYRPIALTCVCRRIYEKYIFKTELESFTALLNDNQGGFRANRNTLHQVTLLHEILRQRKDCKTVFLDLRAAYDLVNRKILWKTLAKDFKMPSTTICKLMELFDFNSSHLVINGKKSNAIENRRGLLQGSSLSPILFNFYINSLMERLKKEDAIYIYGTRINCLFFADDAVIIASSWTSLTRLLHVCEEWSNEYGMEFSASKCILLSTIASPLPLSFYGKEISKEDKTEYLGIMFKEEGISFEDVISKRTTKAKQLIMTMNDIGFHLNGWPIRAQIGVYKTFLRPIMEYGFQLKVMNKKEVQVYQKVQNLAFRCILGAAKKTSINAMHKLLQIETMSLRNTELNAQFYGKINNCTDGRIPIVHIWRNMLQNSKLPTKSLVKNCIEKNPWWNLEQRKKINFREAPLLRQDDAMRKVYPKSFTNQMKREELVKMDKNMNNVSGSIELDEKEKLRTVLDPELLEQKDRVNIVKWMTGNIAMHQKCKRCGNELSRMHAIQCSKVKIYLNKKYPTIIRKYQEKKWNELDVILNHYRKEKERDIFMDLSRCIKRMYVVCLGGHQLESGFWRVP